MAVRFGIAVTGYVVAPMPVNFGVAGGVVSRLIVTDSACVPPALVAEQLSVIVVSLVTEAAPQPLVVPIGESGSSVSQVTATSVRYQPFWPLGAGGVRCGVSTGGVLSRDCVTAASARMK